jgi:hypothetical protein
MKSVALAVVVLLLLGADQSSLTPYSTPLVEQPAPGDSGAFDGLLDLAASSPSSSPVRVLWIHGMCTHPPTWVDDRLQRLLSATGGTSETQSVRAIGGGGASIRTERISTPAGTIDLSFLTWSPLTAPFKARLDRDGSTIDRGRTLFSQATLNRELKRGLVDNCLTDVVVYGGPNGREIRKAATEAMCGVLGGRFDGQQCDMVAGDPPAALALISESLGSQLLFDAITDIWETAERKGDRAAIDRLVDSLAAKRIIYMLANQVPLLVSAGRVPAELVAMGEASTPERPPTNELDVFRVLARARSMAPHPLEPPTVVAFSDPNDILSYRIVPERVTKHPKEFRVVNVLVSNDATYFGYIERPDSAHCGYAWNPYVLGLVAKGYRVGQPFPMAFGVTGGSCLKAIGLTGSGT